MVSTAPMDGITLRASGTSLLNVNRSCLDPDTTVVLLMNPPFMGLSVCIQVHQASHRGQQLAGVEGLRQKGIVGPGQGRSFGLATDQEHREMCVRGTLANRLAQPQPVHPGQDHVADDQADVARPHPPQRLDAVGRVDHTTRRLAEPAQASAEVEPHVGIVIDDQDRQGIHIVRGFSAWPVQLVEPSYRAERRAR
jgi:hypothetical protein